jgi:hypothetical protein
MVVLVAISIAGIFHARKINRELFIPGCAMLGFFGLSTSALKLTDTFAPDSFATQVLLWIDIASLASFMIVLFITVQLAAKRNFIPQDKLWLVKQANIALLLLVPIILFVVIMLKIL